MKTRLDQLLLLRNLAPSMHKGQAMIGAGLITVNDQTADKAGSMFDADVVIEVKATMPYVSRGGLKLKAGLDFFDIDPTDQTCIDVGASTGGFTDCLLQHGAGKVYAVDVGYGQLAWPLRQDDRVVVMERTNARHFSPADIPEPLDLAVIDASFISLRLLIPPLLPLFRRQVSILGLIKPQFEVEKGKVGKGGVVRDETLHQEVIQASLAFGQSLGLSSRGVIASPILGPKGNKEFLVHFVSAATP